MQQSGDGDESGRVLKVSVPQRHRARREVATEQANQPQEVDLIHDSVQRRSGTPDHRARCPYLCLVLHGLRPQALRPLHASRPSAAPSRHSPSCDPAKTNLGMVPRQRQRNDFGENVLDQRHAQQVRVLDLLRLRRGNFVSRCDDGGSGGGTW
jgi:hypothetical protein